MDKQAQWDIETLQKTIGVIPYEEMEQDAIERAIKALEKQIPERIPDDGAFGYCPSCRQIFNSELRNEYVIEYCPWCGQRLDWRVEE